MTAGFLSLRAMGIDARNSPKAIVRRDISRCDAEEAA